MNKETLDHLELCIFAEQTHDINFQNIAKELFREVYLQKSEVDRLNNIINELVKYIQEYSYYSSEKDYEIIDTHDLLDKLKELKGE